MASENSIHLAAQLWCLDTTKNIENDEQDLFKGLTLYKINKHIVDGYGLAYIDVDYECVEDIESIIEQLCGNCFIYSID